MSESVDKWLSDLGLESLSPIFSEQQIDLEAARQLDNADLRELGVPMGPRKKLLRAIAELNAQAAEIPDEGKPAGTAAPEGAFGERRQVTVLFADLCDFTKLSSEIDAEEVHALLDAFFAAADEIVREHGGTVDKHIGDSVMAIFGAPVAYGNEAERAIKTAVAIHAVMPAISERLGLDLKVHIGVASGQVIASAVGGSRDFTVTGSSVNLAARLTDIAGAEQTAVSANVRAALADSLNFGPAQQLNIKGFEKPVEAYLLQSAEGLTVSGEARTKPFIGRGREIAQFRVALNDCLEARAGQLICLRGEAGIGKTRLAEELASIATNAGMTLHRALVLDFGVGRSQDPTRALVRSLLQVAPEAGEDERGTAAARAVDRQLVQQDNLVHLNELLDLPQPPELRSVFDAMDAERRRRGRGEMLAELIKTMAVDEPLFILIEDVHWADSRVIGHLAEIARRISDAPALLVVTTRIEGDPLGKLRRSGLGATAVTTLDLGALRPEEAAQLAAGYDNATSEYVRLCVDRAAGNPLFLEQLLRNAVDSIETTVPDSVQSLVQARMDALPAADRDALQAASVVGQRFSIDVLRKLIESADYDPRELIARHLLQPDGEQLLFAHALVREGVYASLLRSRLETFHRRAAEILGGDDPALRAQHLDYAGDPEAPEAYLIAARAALEQLEDEAALAQCDRGLELTADGKLRSELLRLRGDALRNLGRTTESIETFRTAVDAAEGATETCRALIGLSEGLRVADRYHDALEAIAQAENHAAGLPALERARIHYLRGCVAFPIGRPDDCLAEHTKSLELAQDIGSPSAEASALSGLGDAFYMQGLMRDANARFNECVQISRAHDLGRIEVSNRHMVGWSRIFLMEFKEALEDGLECAEMASRVGNLRAEQAAWLLVAHTQFKLAELEEAEKAIRRALDISESIGTAGFSINQLCVLTEILRDKGKVDEAREAARDAVARMERVGTNFVGPYALGVAASVEPDPEERRKLEAKAGEIFDTGCVSHNYFWFTDAVIDRNIEAEEWDAVEGHISRLEDYIEGKSLAWGEFIAARSRAVAAFARGARDRESIERLAQIAAQAHDTGIAGSEGLLMSSLHAAKAS